MAEENRKRRKRIGAEFTGGPNYGNRTGKKKFHPEDDETNDRGNVPEGEIDYEDLEDKWYEIEEDYKKRYPQLTDEDVTVEPARFDRTIERIGKRIDRKAEEVRREIENWS